MRLSQLQRSLPGISTGVLERYVQQMEALKLLTRTRYKEMPPRVELELTDAGRELLPIAIALARWGMLHMWSLPQARERVGIELLLRAVPILIEDTRTIAEGNVQATLLDRHQPPIHIGYRIRAGRVRVEEPAKAVHSHVAGDTDAWVDALGPAADYKRLSFGGRRALAVGLLDALPRRPHSIAPAN